MNLRLTLAYDGTDFHGWQAQPRYRTVEETLTTAIREMTGEEPRLLCAGRTDSGVHALGQVVSLETKSRIPAEKWRPALQLRLPEDLIIREVVEAPPRFHATYSAIGKRYRYLIYNHRVENLLLRRHSWRVTLPLDVDAMQAAADRLLGTHDFRSFETNWPNNKMTSVRTVRELRIFRTGPGLLFEGLAFHDPVDRPLDMVVIEIEADGFLYKMVRTITGTLVNVGRGTWTPDDVVRILAAQKRAIAGDTCPARGLFLVSVEYPANDADL